MPRDEGSWMPCCSRHLIGTSNKMQPTNPNAHTYVSGTGAETHGYAVTQNTFLKQVNSLVHFSTVTIPVHRRLWNMEEGGVQRVECGV